MKATKAAAAFLAGASLLFTLPAAAQYGLSEDAGFHVGATVGINGDDEAAWRLLGGYQVNRNFALELGYHDLGRHNIAGFPLSTTAWELVGVGRVPLDARFALYGKLGLYRSRSEGGGANEKQTDLTFGAGVEYALSREVAARAEWQRYNDLGGGAIREAQDLDVFSVGVAYRFR